MSKKRLQVLLEEDEHARLRAEAERHDMTLSEWVRQALRQARQRQAEGSIEAKLGAIDRALGSNHPTADIDRMLGEIESGYLGG